MKKNLNTVKKENLSLFVDTDNNNKTADCRETFAYNSSYTIKNESQEQQNENKKTYRFCKSFDPLNCGNDLKISFLIIFVALICTAE